MKVASKIVLVASLAFLPLLCIHTWMSLEREEALFRTDMERDLALLGKHLERIAAIEWSRSGAAGVSSMLADAAKADRRVALEWRSPSRGKRGVEQRPRAVAWVEPVVVDGNTVGEITLIEPLAPMYRYLNSTLVRLGSLTLLLIAAGLLAARLLSRQLIGRRLDRLVQFAADTGSGKFVQNLDVGGRDEITRLGSSLEQMSVSLELARREAERLGNERLSMLQHLRHADRLASVGRLAGSVAHELGTPLNVVMGHATRISEGSQSPAETKESAATIHRQVRRMEATIREILGFVRQAPAEEQRIDLKAVVESVCGLLQPLARARGVELEVDAESAPAEVWGRELQLEQALSNIVSNAIDASPDDGLVVLSISRQEREATLGRKRRQVIAVCVRDQGPGVAEADIAHLFQAFYTSKAAGHGTGLGLWLADGIIRNHDGSIEVENGADGGACFTIALPACELD